MLFYMLHGVYDRSTVNAKKVVVTWPTTIQSLLTKLEATPAPTKLTHWCALYAECDDTHPKLDALSVTRVTSIVFDVDESNGATFQDITDTFDTLGCGYYAWETWQSRPGAVRARVVIPLATPIPISQVGHEWEGIAAELGSTIVVHRGGKGKPMPTEGLVVDKTCCEPSRLHVLPVPGMSNYINTAALRVPTAPSVEVEPGAMAGVPEELGTLNTKVSVPLAEESEVGDSFIEWEADPMQTTLVSQITPEDIVTYSRPSEPGKARCQCPHKDTANTSGSYSAWARFVRGVLYISCTSANHNHPAGMTWAVKQSLGVGEFIYPVPYLRSTSHALVALNQSAQEEGKNDGSKKKRKEAGGDKYRVISFTAPLVTKLYQDGETHDEWWKIEWSHITHHGTHSVVLRRDECGSANKLTERAGRMGLDVNESNKKELTRFFSEFVSHNRARIPVQMTASRLGWFGDSFLMGNTWIAGDDGMMRELVQTPADGTAKLARSYQSVGTLGGWAQGFHKLLAYPMAVVGIMAAVASPLLQRVGCQSFAFEWASGTGTGKTTSMRMAESVFAKPIDCEASWDNTKVGFERKAAFLGHLPMFLDDTKTASESGDRLTQALEWAIYRAVSGEGRGRGKPGGLEASSQWNLVLFSTGEEPIYGLGQSGGARARLLSIQAPPFDALTGGEVSRIVAPIADPMYANYGTLGPAVVQTMTGYSSEVLRGQWAKRRDKWLTYLGSKHSAADRVSSHIAVIDLAGSLIKKTLRDSGVDHPDFDPGEVCRLLADALIEIDQQSGVVDPALRSFAAFYSWALSHRHNFYTVDNRGTGPTGGWLGRWDGGDNWTEMYFNAPAVQKFLKDTGFPGSPTTLTATWARRGLLERYQGNDYRWPTRMAGSSDRLWRANKESLLGIRAKAQTVEPITIEESVEVLDV